MERHVFDPNQPTGSMNLENMRNVLRALYQGDFSPLRSRASLVLDDFEYPTDALAQAAWSGTGVSVTKSTTKQEGNYSVSLGVDGTGNRSAAITKSLDLSMFKYITLWERVNVSASAFQFYVRDSIGNESYWDLTSDATQDTWKQDTLTLASPDSNSGTAASLALITSFGFKGLDTSKVYLMDTIKAIVGMSVAVEPSLIAAFYQNMYLGSTRLTYAGGGAPVFTAPAANPRYSLLTIDSSNVLAWTHGSEAGSPTEPAVPAGKMPLCLVYCKTAMARVVDFEDAAANPNEGYIARDVRPLYLQAAGSFIGLSDVPASFSGSGGKGVGVNSGATALEFYTKVTTLLQLTDFPATYAGQSKKKLRINAGETGVEFVADTRFLIWHFSTSMILGTRAHARFYMPFAGAFSKVRIDAKTGPTGTDLIIDINKNGNTIWSTQANRAKVVAGANVGSTTTFNTGTFTTDDYIDIDIDQIGSVLPGSDVTVQLEFLV